MISFLQGEDSIGRSLLNDRSRVLREEKGGRALGGGVGGGDAPLFAEAGVAEWVDGAVGHSGVALVFVLGGGPGEVGGVRDFGAFAREVTPLMRRLRSLTRISWGSVRVELRFRK